MKRPELLHILWLLIKQKQNKLKMKKLSILLGLILTTFIYGQKKEQIILEDEPSVVIQDNFTVKLEKYYDKVLVSINAVKINTPIIYRGLVSSTVGTYAYSSYHISNEGWKRLESTDKSSGYLDYNNYGILELTATDMENTYKVYIFSAKMLDAKIGMFVQIDKL